MNAKSAAGDNEWADPDDAPELTDAFFETATYEENGVALPRPSKVGRPRAETPKVHTGLRLDADILQHFKAAGPGWQTRINAALREAISRERLV